MGSIPSPVGEQFYGETDWYLVVKHAEVGWFRTPYRGTFDDMLATANRAIGHPLIQEIHINRHGILAMRIRDLDSAQQST